MKNIGTKEIVTDRLILRRFRRDDAPDMYKNWASDDEVTKYLTWPTHKNVDITDSVLTDWVNSYENDDYYQWAIVPKYVGEVIGSIGAVAVDSENEVVEIGYCIGKAFWHNGYASEALSALINFFMKEVHTKNVIAKHDVRNTRSGRVMERAGMTLVGKAQDVNNQGDCDINIYSVKVKQEKGENKMTITSEEIAKGLLSIGAVFLRPDEPFTWASGIKSPIYCDNRLTLTAPSVRNNVEKGLGELINEYYPEAEVLMGTSTAGIAHAAITADYLDMPMGYVRSGAKNHGRTNQIEGKLEKGQKVVVVEDLISTGGSVIEVVNALRDAGAEVVGIVSIFTYGMKKGLERLKEANVMNISLCNLDILLEVAAKEKYIKPEDVDRIKKFRDNPSDESWIQQ